MAQYEKDAIPDPFTEPHSGELKADNPLHAAVTKLLAPKGAREKVIFATPAAWPSHVSDAVADGSKCDACGQEVWVSPSTRPSLAEASILCMECLLREVSRDKIVEYVLASMLGELDSMLDEGE